MEREACGFRTHFPFLALALARKGGGGLPKIRSAGCSTIFSSGVGMGEGASDGVGIAHRDANN